MSGIISGSHVNVCNTVVKRSTTKDKPYTFLVKMVDICRKIGMFFLLPEDGGRLSEATGCC